MRCRLSVLPAADGSAMLDQGTTKVLAAVYGPREVPQRGDVLHDRCSIRCDCTYVRARHCTALHCGVTLLTPPVHSAGGVRHGRRQTRSST
jgi:3' exoribonuclease family, domain 1